jgi:ferric-dicitrate binding protein FerR (iron transport regulator)
MSAREEQVRSLIAQDAADWFVASRAGLTASERNDFGKWPKASPVHVEEYLALARLVGATCARPVRPLGTPWMSFWPGKA